jgi:hypothetical protein
MKTMLLLLSIFLSVNLFGQTTAIPDLNFEQYLITLGYDSGTPDGTVITADIIDVWTLSVSGQNINDLTGIEDFIALQVLDCDWNNLTDLDLSNNTLLDRLVCANNLLTSLDLTQNLALNGNLRLNDNQLTSIDMGQVSGSPFELDIHLENNQLTSIDLSQCSNLDELYISNNNLTSLDISANLSLDILACRNNQLTSLDLSSNNGLKTLAVSNNQLTQLNLSNLPQLEAFACDSNELTCLNANNLNNVNMGILALNNPNLTCIKVDDADWAAVNWSPFFDSQASFSEDCGNDCNGSLSITNLNTANSKNLIKTIDLIGRETTFKLNTPIIEIYDDGSTQKKIVVE